MAAIEAEIEEAIEVIEEAESAIEGEAEGEAIEELDPVEKEEFKKVCEKAEASLEVISKDASAFKKLMEGSMKTLKEFSKFVAHNMAIGAILFFTNVGLEKLIKLTKDPKKKKDLQAKHEKVNAIHQLVMDEKDLCDKIKDWLEKHKDDTIVLADIELPLESIFERQLKPLVDSCNKAYEGAKHLMQKSGSKYTWVMPTAGDVQLFLDTSDTFQKALSDLRKFAQHNEGKVSSLKLFLDVLTQDSIDKIKNDLDIVKQMPF